MFADDCCIYNSGNDLPTTKHKFQNSVEDANLWYTNNNLPLNLDKSYCMLSASEYMLRRLSTDDKTIDISVNGVKIKQVLSVKHLGVILDNELKWTDNVQKMCSKISKKLGLLNRLRKFLDRDILRYLYNSIIQADIDYAITVWGFSSKSNLALVSRLQHRAARIISGNMNYIDFRGDDIMREVGIQDVITRRHYFLSTMMYKIVNDIAPIHLRNKFTYTRDTHDVHTRAAGSDTLQIPDVHYEKFRSSLKYQGSLLWNSLPAGLKSASSVDSFKSCYKKLYFKSLAV